MTDEETSSCSSWDVYLGHRGVHHKRYLANRHSRSLTAHAALQRLSILKSANGVGEAERQGSPGASEGDGAAACSPGSGGGGNAAAVRPWAGGTEQLRITIAGADRNEGCTPAETAQRFSELLRLVAEEGVRSVRLLLCGPGESYYSIMHGGPTLLLCSLPVQTGVSCSQPPAHMPAQGWHLMCSASTTQLNSGVDITQLSPCLACRCLSPVPSRDPAPAAAQGPVMQHSVWLPNSSSTSTGRAHAAMQPRCNRGMRYHVQQRSSRGSISSRRGCTSRSACSLCCMGAAGHASMCMHQQHSVSLR